MLAARVTQMFFNQKAVINAAGKARVTILSKAGYKVQQAGKALLIFKPPLRKPRLSRDLAKRREQLVDFYARKKANASPPGKPPYIRRRNYPNLASIVYAFNPATQGVMVGPIERRSRSSAEPVPGIAERGGKTIINVKTKRGIKPMTANYPARPVMGPALVNAAPEIPQVMAGTVVGP